MKRLLAFLSLCWLTNVWGQDIPSISEVSLKLADSQSLPLAEKISFSAQITEPASLVAHLRQFADVKVSVEGQQVNVIMPSEARFLGKVTAKHKTESFVVDISEATTQDFINGFEQAGNNQVALTKLTSYVADYITETTYVHGFNFASVVARDRSGDCTEFAVLSTALARALQLPARIMFGVVIVEETSEVKAYGHAWSEVFQDNKWQIVDAALYHSKARQKYYLPTGPLQNEGPGYAMSMINSVSSFPVAITSLKSSL